MQIVIADTTPIRYLAEIGHLDLLPRLFDTVYIPSVVFQELQQPETPFVVLHQIEAYPSWLKIVSLDAIDCDPAFLTLDAGERAALTLGLQLKADLILIDERKAASIARKKGLEITGTLGILVRAARRNMLTLRDAFARLRRTSFRCPEHLMNDILAQNQREERPP